MAGQVKRTTSSRGEGVAALRKKIADLQNELGQRTAALDDALEQQSATAEVLQVINSSPGDLAPVFDAMLEKATRLCEAAFGILNTYEDARFRTVTLRGVPRPLQEFLLQFEAPPPAPESPPGRIIDGEDVVQVDDLAVLEGNRDARGRAMVELGGARSYVTVSLRKDGRLLGTITAYRQEVRPFSDKQIALLQNFAAQAVIAMENARLITETREALEQQTATAEVLGVINSSPGDLAPVFDAILEKAHNLCGAEQGVLVTYDGENFQGVATHGLAEPLAEVWRKPSRATPGSGQEQLLGGERLVHIADVASVDVERPDHPFRRAIIEAGFRTLLMVPLRKEGNLLGYITAIRNQVNPFNEKQISLLENFAAQAVIAMENARLITETREALGQQTATAEVLGVINSSPGDLAPVFDAMLDKGMRLCEADFAGLWTYDGEHVHPAALHRVPPAYAEFMTRRDQPVSPDNTRARLIRGEPFVHIPDAADLPANPLRRAFVELGGGRAQLAVPLRKDAMLVGILTVYRREARPFTDKQIALLQNFAGQAVIAMENARLITETREALEQQTATAEVLGVINSSPGDLAPVFDAMVERAMGLCDAFLGGLQTYDGETFVTVAARGNVLPVGTTVRPQPGFLLERLVRGEDIVHVTNVFED